MRIARPDGQPNVALRVSGTPKTAGSKRAFVNPRTGRAILTDDAGAKGKAWRSLVADAGEAVRGGADLLTGPLYVEMTFFRSRPKGHYGSGRNCFDLKGSAPAFPTTRPDVLKHARAVEDALTGVLWRDDASIVSGPYEKVYAGPGDSEGVEVRIWLLPATVRELALADAPRLGVAA